MNMPQQSIVPRFFAMLCLVAFLCAFFAHSTHNEAIAESGSHVECHFCVNAVDKPHAEPLNLANEVISYFAAYCGFSSVLCVSNNYISPNLRAPPAPY